MNLPVRDATYTIFSYILCQVHKTKKENAKEDVKRIYDKHAPFQALSFWYIFMFQCVYFQHQSIKLELQQ